MYDMFLHTYIHIYIYITTIYNNDSWFIFYVKLNIDKWIHQMTNEFTNDFKTLFNAKFLAKNWKKMISKFIINIVHIKKINKKKK